MLRLVRYWIPAVVVLGGVIAMAAWGFSDDALEGGGAIIGAGLSIFLMNFLWRIGVTGDTERGDEDEARAYFDEHGRWPDDTTRRRPAA